MTNNSQSLDCKTYKYLIFNCIGFFQGFLSAICVAEWAVPFPYLCVYEIFSFPFFGHPIFSPGTRVTYR